MSPKTLHHVSRHRRGFSLPELTIVILILSIISVITIPRYFDLIDTYRVELAAGRLVSDLKYASTRARVTSTVIRVKFYKDNNPVKSYYEFEGLADPYTAAATYRVDLLRPPYEVIFTRVPSDIEFDIYGMPKDDREWIIQHPSDPSLMRTIRISKTTGEISVT